MKKIVCLLSALSLLVLLQIGVAQQHDYPAYPKTDLVFEHLDAILEINEQMQIRGEVTYTVRFKIGVTDSLQLLAGRMQIDDVLVNDRTMNYEINDDKLTVFIDEQFNRNDTATIHINYTTEPAFGVLKNYSGTMFTSQLPRSASHWLPGLDHPGISMTTNFTVAHPSSQKLVMTGRETGNSVISVEQEETRFESRYPVPITSLFLVLGDFQSESRTINTIQYHIHSEQPNGVDIEKYQLMELASEAVQTMEELTGAEYPYRDLHIVMVQDLVWEIRTFGAGSILADMEFSSEEQIKYGIMGQWAGVMLREMQWSQPEALQLLMGYFANELDLEAVERESMQDWDSLYKATSLDNINRFSHYLQNDEHMEMIMNESLTTLFDQRDYPVSWNDFSRVVYRTTGQPLFEKPHFEAPEIEEEQIYHYQVNIEHAEEENEVMIRFQALDDAVDELVSVSINEYSFNASRERELTFTGSSDEIVLSVPAGIENLVLSIDERDDIRLELQKPFMFWLHQIRNGETADQRKDAAAGLLDYSDNPDLQLALLDIIEMDSDPDVYAEIVRTLSFVTSGASGTSQLFLDRTGSGQPENVRTEAVRALASYGENDMVISRLQSIIRSAETENLRKEATHSLAAVTDLTRFTTITESMILEESVLNDVPLLLENLAAKGGEEKTVQLSRTFLSSEFPYEIRSRVLLLVLNHDQSQQGWERRIEPLLNDRDPRIRYLSVGGLQYLSNQKREQLIDIRLAEEFDERVYRAIEQVR
ncbi:hypothetical protein BH23BAC3_BH23BAC3_09710 [soil metagenome]